VPDYEKSIKKVRAENPDVADVAVKPGNWFDRMMTAKGVRATASPWTGNVTYFPERMASEGMDENQIENTLTHELTHSRQTRAMNPLQRLFAVGRSILGGEEEYGQRPRELEAFQAEKDRSRRLGLRVPSPYTGARDIQLPPMSARRKALDTFAQERKIRGLE
jgi:hypothetical protein